MFRKRNLIILLLLMFFAREIFAVAPVINSITPNTSYNTASTEITVSGANFAQNSKVCVGSGGAYIRGSVDTTGNAMGVYVMGNYAYVADWSSGLQVVDVSNPASPCIVDGVGVFDCAYGVYALGNYVYIAKGNII